MKAVKCGAKVGFRCLVRLVILDKDIIFAYSIHKRRLQSVDGSVTQQSIIQSIRKSIS